jgi:citrate lyase subunit beta/citryl-CoA lyase
MTTVLPRSYLYVPGDASDKLGRALERGADALIIDLEDGVAPSSRPAARRAVAAWLAGLPPASNGRTEVWVRVPSGPSGDEDVEAIVTPALTGICVAKAGRRDLDVLKAKLTRFEVDRGLGIGVIALLPLVETAGALAEVGALARSARVARLQLGEIDLAADLGLTPSDDEHELLWARSAAVVASAAAHIGPPVGAVSADFRDLEHFAATTERQRRLGFYGRACVHPAQVAIANRIFMPSEDEVARAQALLDAFDAAVRREAGVAITPDGKMVDEAVVRAARTVLVRARQNELRR